MKKMEWHNEIIYQIYPKSFKDSTDTGYGDICGIINKLDYLQDLGVSCVWISPVFESPMKDNGYDISNYLKIDPIFGTNEDMYLLIKKAKEHGIMIMLDLVVNHTSDQHEWFKEARKSKDNKYRDYYIWRDNKNEMESIFLGDAWEYDETTKQYYFHLFAKEQPDLNWDNVELRNEIYKMMNFWIDKGVGGFRMDVIEFLGKQPDNMITSDGPNLHKYIYEMNRNTFGVRDCITVGESWSATDDTAKLYTDPKRDELSMIFRFDQITAFWDKDLGKWKPRMFDLVDFKKILFERQKEENRKNWNSLFWGNHDLPRAVSYYIKEGFETEGAKMLFAIQMFMSGTPFIFQGDEIGMTNHNLSPEDYRDVEAKNALQMILKEGYDPKTAVQMINKMSRDNARTPMQWDDSLNAGFSQVEPWIKINQNHKFINVKSQIDKSNSVLSFYKNVIALRKNSECNEVILYGDFEGNLLEDKRILTYRRKLGNNKITVIANFSNEVVLYENDIDQNKVLINNYPTFKPLLQPYQVMVFKD